MLFIDCVSVSIAIQDGGRSPAQTTFNQFEKEKWGERWGPNSRLFEMRHSEGISPSHVGLYLGVSVGKGGRGSYIIIKHNLKS